MRDSILPCLYQECMVLTTSSRDVWDWLLICQISTTGFAPRLWLRTLLQANRIPIPTRLKLRKLGEDKVGAIQEVVEAIQEVADMKIKKEVVVRIREEVVVIEEADAIKEVVVALAVLVVIMGVAAVAANEIRVLVPEQGVMLTASTALGKPTQILVSAERILIKALGWLCPVAGDVGEPITSSTTRLLTLGVRLPAAQYAMRILGMTIMMLHLVS